MLKQTKTDKAIDARIDRAYRTTCAGVQINIMDISKVFQHGRRLIVMDHVDDAQLAAGVREYVETIRQN